MKSRQGDATDKSSRSLRARVPVTVKAPLKIAIFGYRRLTSSLRVTPDFLVIGAARSGTTSLYRYLASHPSIAPASMKEIQYFSIHHWRGIEWYKSHFPTSLTRRVVTSRSGVSCQTGEATPYYMFHPLAAGRVADALPRVKLIVLLRNPVDRAFSHYLHELSLGVEDRSFEKAIDDEEVRLSGEVERMLSDPKYPGFRHQHFSYLSRGLYHDQLVRWFSLFPRDRFLIMQSERFWSDPEESHVGTLKFLGLPPTPLASYPQFNTSEPSRMTDRTRDRLLEYFAPHNERLNSLLGEDFRWEVS